MLASRLQQLIPAPLIHAANNKSPNNTTITDHTERPYLCINLANAVTQYVHRHDIMWDLTDVLITAFMTHKNWTFTTPPLSTDDRAIVAGSTQQSSADSSDALLADSAVPKASPPHAPGTFSG